MLCKGFTIPNFNPKKDNFFVMLHFTCTCIKFFTKKVFKLLKKQKQKKKQKNIAYFHNQ